MSNEPFRSYTATGDAPGFLHEAHVLWQRTRRAAHLMPAEVRALLAEVREAERIVEAETGLRVLDRDVLEIGPGQLPRQLAYFAAKNRVVGIDMDVVPRAFDIAGYYRLWRTNGLRRLIKTVARKALGFDAKFHRELKRQLGLPRLPEAPIRAMDAKQMAFHDASFDFVYSFSVFEHLSDPATVLREGARVLRPGGVIFTHLHLYTCDNGHHDMRITPTSRDGLPYWPHLRPQHQGLVQPFAFINRLRLAEWRALFEDVLPGSVFHGDMDGEVHRAELARLRASGELDGYADEELLTHNLIAVWKKPLW